MAVKASLLLVDVFWMVLEAGKLCQVFTLEDPSSIVRQRLQGGGKGRVEGGGMVWRVTNTGHAE
jgi:hypothetical protein